MQEIARDVAVVSMSLVNAYLVGDRQSWVLIDSGTPGSADTIQQAADARFGTASRPRAIVLTHGHFDHAGSAKQLAAAWNVKVYAHRLERPYLTGRSLYPPPDPSAPGVFAILSRFFPAKPVTVDEYYSELVAGTLPELRLADWQFIETPGHTPGHVSFFRRSDSTLLAGDALTTVNVDNALDLITKRQQVCRPPTPATTDWPQARKSVQALNALRVRLIAAGHGVPMSLAADQLAELAKNFPIPEHGRYVPEPARADETGVTYLPPKPPDRLLRTFKGFAVATLLAAAGVVLLRKMTSGKKTAAFSAHSD